MATDTWQATIKIKIHAHQYKNNEPQRDKTPQNWSKIRSTIWSITLKNKIGLTTRDWTNKQVKKTRRQYALTQYKNIAQKRTQKRNRDIRPTIRYKNMDQKVQTKQNLTIKQWTKEQEEKTTKTFIKTKNIKSIDTERSFMHAHEWAAVQPPCPPTQKFRDCDKGQVTRFSSIHFHVTKQPGTKKQARQKTNGGHQKRQKESKGEKTEAGRNRGGGGERGQRRGRERVHSSSAAAMLLQRQVAALQGTCEARTRRDLPGKKTNKKGTKAEKGEQGADPTGGATRT